MREIKNRIRDLRDDMDLRQIDVAEATGIDQKTLSNYETGKTNPDSYALIRLAQFFDVSIDYLVGFSDFNIKTNKQLCELVASMEQQLAELKRHLQ